MVRDDDDAMWRRILRIPFDQVIPKAKRDPKLKIALKDPARVGPAILTWAVEGCRLWQLGGLGIPSRVQAATDAYRNEMDPLRDFLGDCCLIEPAANETSADLWTAYCQWATDNSEEFPLTRHAFSDRLKARGLKAARKKKDRTRVFLGIRLLSNSPSSLESEGGRRTEADGDLGNSSHNARHEEELSKPPPAAPAVSALDAPEINIASKRVQ
jgi:putative DNA primase/helicase